MYLNWQLCIFRYNLTFWVGCHYVHTVASKTAQFFPTSILGQREPCFPWLQRNCAKRCQDSPLCTVLMLCHKKGVLQSTVHYECWTDLWMALHPLMTQFAKLIFCNSSNSFCSLLCSICPTLYKQHKTREKDNLLESVRQPMVWHLDHWTRIWEVQVQIPTYAMEAHWVTLSQSHTEPGHLGYLEWSRSGLRSIRWGASRWQHLSFNTGDVLEQSKGALVQWEKVL